MISALVRVLYFSGIRFGQKLLWKTGHPMLENDFLEESRVRV